MRTITANERLARATRFLPVLTHFEPDVQWLFNVRNALSTLATPFPRRARSSWLKASEEVRAALDLDRVSYWGDFVGLADSTLEEHVVGSRLRAEAAIAAAKAAFARRFDPMDEATRQAVIAALVTQRIYAYEEDQIKCPACGSQAVSGSTDTRWDYDDEDSASFHRDLPP
jgi:hypothetical protein